MCSQVAEPIAFYVDEVLERIPGAIETYEVQRLLVAVKGFTDEFMRRDKQVWRFFWLCLGRISGAIEQ